MASANNFQFTFDVSGILNLIGTISQIQALLQVLRVAAASGGPGAAQAGVAAGLLQQQLQMLKFSLAVSAAVVVLVKLGEVINQTTERLLSFSTAQGILGSGGAMTGALLAMGRAFGFDAAAAARRVQQLSLSGVGAAMLSQLGIGPMFQFGQRVDRGEALFQMLTRLAEMWRRGERDRVEGFLQTTGQEDLRNTIIAIQDPKTAEAFRRIGEMAKELNNSAAVEQAARTRVRLTELFTLIEGIVQKLTTPLLAVWNFILEGINFWLRKKFSWLIPGIGGDAQTKGLDANTQATIDNTAELRQMNGFHGGGRRARTALPGASGMGWALKEQFNASTQRLGAFSVSL